MSTVCRQYDGAIERHVTARKSHVCEWCREPIKAGTTYVVVTEYPGGDAGYADAAGHPVRIAIHAEAPCHYHGGAS